MRIRYNEDAEVVARLRAALLKRDLQCPCRLQKIEDNVCMCKEFRDQIADPEFEGYCQLPFVLQGKVKIGYRPMVFYHTSEKSSAQNGAFSFHQALHILRDSAVKCNSSPVTGWVNHSSYECSAGRAMRVLSSVP